MNMKYKICKRKYVWQLQMHAGCLGSNLNLALTSSVTGADVLFFVPFGICQMNDRILWDTRRIMSNNVSHQYLTTKAQQTLASSMLFRLSLMELHYFNYSYVSQ